MIRGGDIGKMDVLLTIQQSTATRDSVTSEEALSWSTLTTAWAEKLPTYRSKGPVTKEIIEGAQVVAKKESFYRIRWVSGLLTGMRVLRDSSVEYILSIEEVDRRKFLVVTTEIRDNE